jgi:phospholipase C
MNRRELLKCAAGAAAGEIAALALHGCGGGSSGTTSPTPVGSACSNLNSIEHVVIFIQENRSFGPAAPAS